jgi:hypothetical protein
MRSMKRREEQAAESEIARFCKLTKPSSMSKVTKSVNNSLLLGNSAVSFLSASRYHPRVEVIDCWLHVRSDSTLFTQQGPASCNIHLPRSLE